MFFSKNRKYRKTMDALGPHINSQIAKAINARQEVFSNPAEIAFVAGYLYSVVWLILDTMGCKDYDTQNKMLKHLCDGVIPGRLWDIVERGKAMSSSFFGDENLEYKAAKDAHEAGKDSGLHDAMEISNGKAPDNLRRYLLGEEINIDFFL